MHCEKAPPPPPPPPNLDRSEGPSRPDMWKPTPSFAKAEPTAETGRAFRAFRVSGFGRLGFRGLGFFFKAFNFRV